MWRLTGNIYFVTICAILGAVRFGFMTTVVVEGSILLSYTAVRDRIGPLIITSGAIGMVLDISLAVVLCVTLARSKSGLKKLFRHFFVVMT